MREKFRALQIKLTQAPSQIDRSNTAQTSDKLKKLLVELSESALDSKGYLPHPYPFSFAEMAPKADDFKVFWQKMDGWVVALDEIISRGMAQAWGELSTHSASNDIMAINTTVRNLDKLAKGDDNAPALDPLKTKIEGELSALRTNIPPSRAAGPFPRFKEESERIKFEIEFINWAVWGVMLVLTTLVGSYIVVLSNLGFGLWSDYLLCLFWGFGIPIGGQQILQMTSTNVATTLGITVTKP